MSLRSHLCLPAPGRTTGAKRVGGAPTERLLSPAPARTLQPRALHAALAASPSSRAFSACLRQRLGRSGIDVSACRLSALWRSSAAPPQPVRASIAQTAALRSGATFTQTARPCIAAADASDAQSTVHYQGAMPVSHQTCATGRLRRLRDTSSFGTPLRRLQRKSALSAALRVTASWGNRGNSRPTACSVSCRWGAMMSVSTPRQPAVAAARWHRRRSRAANGEPAEQAPDASGSLSDGVEGDPEVSRELEEFDIERFRRVGAHLDLMWNVAKKPKPEPCDCCEGSGRRRCEYCHGTGAMMVGDERFCSLEQGCKPCPVCNSTGEIKCFHCNGTGFRAAWLEPGCPVRVTLVTASFKNQEARDTWVSRLKMAIKPSHEEAGTLSYQLSYGVQDPLQVLLYERYADGAALDAHMTGTWPPLKAAWEAAGFTTTPGTGSPVGGLTAFDVQLFDETDVGFMTK